MHSDLALYLMATAVAVSSLALLIGAIAIVGVYRSVRKMQEDITPLIPEVKATLAQAQEALTQTTKDAREISERLNGVLDAAEKHLNEFDQAKTEVMGHLRVQGERAELVLEDILSRVQEVVGVLHGTVLRPVREVSGIVSGVKAAVQTFLLGRRPTVDRATQDDEMFI